MKPTLNRTIKKELALLSEQYSGWWVSSYPLTVPGRAAFTRNCVIGEPTFNNNFEVDNNIPQLGQVFMGWGGPTMMRFIAPHSFTSNDHIAGQGGLIDNPTATCPPYNNNCVGDPNQTWAIKQVTEVFLPGGQTMSQWCPEWCSGQSFGPTSAQPSPLCDVVALDEYHMWTECSNFTGGGGSESMTWSGLPGYVSGADPNNSLIFYDWIDTTIGGISVGDVIKIDLSANNQNYTLCLQYDGVTNNVTPVTPWNSPLTIVSTHPNCDDCINDPEMPYCCLLGGTPCFQITFPTECDWGTTYPDLPTCQANCGDPEERGCLDPSALNYNQCCPNTPGCFPVLPDPDCCRYEQGDNKGCMDITAINYMTCCDPNIPNCVPNSNSPECCRYEDDPNPCKTNPKECWFCEPGDINTSGWIDPMALTNANGGCIQFLSTSATFASGYSGQMYTTQSDCTANSECKPTGGDRETKQCTCCRKEEGGLISGFSVTQSIPVGDPCSQFDNSQPGVYGCADSTIWDAKDCEPRDDHSIAEEIKRYKQLL